MNTIPHGGVVFLTIIAGRKQKEPLLTALIEAGGRLVNVIYGKGSVKSGYLQDMLGLVPEENKVIITCLAAAEKTDSVFEMLVNKFHFDKPNTGIAFTTHVDKLSL